MRQGEGDEIGAERALEESMEGGGEMKLGVDAGLVRRNDARRDKAHLVDAHGQNRVR